MPVIEGGLSAEVMGVGAQVGVPAHTVNRPIPFGSLGHYRIALTTGTLPAALAAGGQLFTARWTDATRFMVVTRFKASFQALTGFTAATLTDFGFDLLRATSVSAGGGGTAVTAFPKMRNSMATSLLSATDMRIATTAALTALTTLEAVALASSLGDQQRVNPAAATEEQRVNDPTLLFQPDIASGEYPLVLIQNEGLVLRNRAVWPAAGTGIVQIELSWVEVTAY